MTEPHTSEEAFTDEELDAIMWATSRGYDTTDLDPHHVEHILQWFWKLKTDLAIYECVMRGHFDVRWNEGEQDVDLRRVKPMEQIEREEGVWDSPTS